MSSPNPEPLVVSWSEINSYRTCPHKHMLEYKMRWSKKNNLNTALGKGTLFHAVVEQYYLGRMEGKPLAECVKAAHHVLDSVPVQSDSDEEAVAIVRWMFEGYHERYYGDSLWNIRAVEHKFRVPLPTLFEGQREIILKGSIDLIVRDEKNRLLVLDHKTCSTLPKEQDYALSDQFSLYLWALRELGNPSFMAVHNAVKTKMNKGDIPGEIERWEVRKEAGERAGVRPKMQSPEERFSRTYMDRMPSELDTIAREATATVLKAYGLDNRHERTPKEDTCKYMCSFTEACLRGRKYGDQEELSNLAELGFAQNFTRH